MAKLFGLYPPRDDAEISLVSYLQETRDVPPHWLRRGCRRIRNEGERVFLPSISELRSACALEVRDEMRARRGIGDYSPNGQVAFQPAKMLAWARRECPGPVLQGGAEPKRLEASR